jgi:hypothetical protein
MQQKQCKLISFQMYISNDPGIQFRASFYRPGSITLQSNTYGGQYRDRKTEPRVMVQTTRNDNARARGKRNITFTVSAMTQGQSVSPDIALHISIYCVYCIEDEYLTHNINAQKLFNQLNVCFIF